MYRIVKRIVRTVTTVTWMIRWDDLAGQKSAEKQITPPKTEILTREEVVGSIDILKNVSQEAKPVLFDEGEIS